MLAARHGRALACQRRLSNSNGSSGGGGCSGCSSANKVIDGRDRVGIGLEATGPIIIFPIISVHSTIYFKQCVDYRLGYAAIGPFLNHEEFHSFLRGYVLLESCIQVYGESVTLCHTRQYRPSFSHADLFPRNIIVRDGKNVLLKVDL
jgi:hypothetical protein